MGRTYKKNDLHRSRRPKSIREKRNYSNKRSPDQIDNYDNPSRNKNYKDFNSIDYTEEDWPMNENMLQCDWIDDILNETICDDLTIFDQDTSELYDDELRGDFSWVRLSN